MGPRSTATPKGTNISYGLAARNAKVAAILASNAPNGAKDAAASVGKHEDSSWQTFLNVLGKGKTAVVAGVAHTVDPNRNFMNDMKNNVGTGDVLAGADWYKDLPTWAKIGVGLVGDVAADPLTYLSGAGAIGKIGGARGAAKLAFEASTAATTAAETSKFAQLGQKAAKGMSLLSPVEKDAIAALAVKAGKIDDGAKLGGLYMNVPGTGRIVRGAAKKMGLTGPQARQIQLIGQSDALSTIPRALQKGTEGLRASAVGKSVGGALGGNETKRALTDMMRRGDPEDAAGAFHGIDGWNLGEAKQAQFIHEMSGERSGILKAANDAGISMDDISRALNLEPAAIDRLNGAIPGFADRVKAFDNNVVDVAHRINGVEFVAKTEGHAPSLAGPGIKGGVPYGGQRSPFSQAGFEMGSAKPGDTFLGEILAHPTQSTEVETTINAAGKRVTKAIDPSEVDAARAAGRDISTIPADPSARGWHTQMDEIASANFGGDYKQMLNRNWEEASKAQINGMGSRLKAETIKNHLVTKGIAKPLFEEQLTKAALNAQSKLPEVLKQLKYSRITRKIAKAVSDTSPQTVRKAQEDSAYLIHEATAAADHATQRAARTAELFGTADPMVAKLLDEASTAEGAARLATADRQLSEQLISVLGPDHPMIQAAVEPFQQAVASARAAAVAGEDAAITANRMRMHYADQVKIAQRLMDDAAVDAKRIKEIVDRQNEVLRSIDQSNGVRSRPAPQRQAADVNAAATNETQALAARDATTSADEAWTTAQMDMMAHHELTAKIGEFEGFANGGQMTRAELDTAVYEFNQILGEMGLPAIGNRKLVPDVLRQMNSAADDALKGIQDASAAAQKGLSELGLSSKLGPDTIPVAGINAEHVPQALRGAERGAPSINRKAAQAELKKLQSELSSLEGKDPVAAWEKAQNDLKMYRKGVHDAGYWQHDATLDANQARQAQATNQARITEISNQKVTTGNAHRDSVIQSKLDTELSLRDEATRLRKEADSWSNGEMRTQRLNQQFNDMAAGVAEGDAALAIDKSLAGVANLEATAAQNEADLLRLMKRGSALEMQAGKLSLQQNQTRFVNVLEDGFASLGLTTQAPEHIVEALMTMTRMADPKEVGMFLKGFDYLTSVFKSWAIATPGFHVRNFLGGTFNNYLAGVNFGSYRAFHKADKMFLDAMDGGMARDEAFALVGKRLGNKEGAAYRTVHDSYSMVMPGQAGAAGAEAGVGTGGGRGVKGLVEAMGTSGERGIVIDNWFTRANLKGSERVERTLRGTLAYDVAMKGGDHMDALSAVHKFHFNYDDLSQVERGTMKRISPFYTWTRKNLPLQMEMVFQKPEAYARIGYLKNEVELQSKSEDLVPAWFSDSAAMRLPFKNPFGEQMYMMPDLPAMSLQKLTDPKKFLGEINPLIKLPLELKTNQQLYNGQNFREGYVPFPKSFEMLGIGALADVAGMTEKDEQGNRMIRDKTLYAMESFMPLLGRARRAFPSEEKYQRRAVTSWMSMMLGLSFRANTEVDQAGELYRQANSLEKLNVDLQSLKFGGYRTKSKDIPVTRNPTKEDKSPFVMVTSPKGGLPKNSPYQVASRSKYAKKTSPLDKALAALEKQGASTDLMDIVRELQGIKTP